MSIINILERKKRGWMCVLILIIAIKLWAYNHYNIEVFYTNKFYYFFSAALRFLFGWMTFSFGDVLYFIAGCWLLWKLVKNVNLIFKKKITKALFLQKLAKLIFIFVTIYIVFNIFWGLNYNRKGIAWQLNLKEITYDTSSLKQIQQLLLKKVNDKKRALVNQKAFYPDDKDLFKRAEYCYRDAAKKYPFIEYKTHSVKPSMYGWLGNYLGFTGYYNPFTGEAQVNTTIPKFLLPYITLHEIGHQLGYAKEDEASFSGYLAAVNSHDTLFQYSAYLDLYIYANREVFHVDSTASKFSATQLIPEVKADLLEWKRFNEAHKSFWERPITWLYGKYLQINQQPKGMGSYNEVIGMLIAYYKKYGEI
jgi:hypothetical protein